MRETRGTLTEELGAVATSPQAARIAAFEALVATRLDESYRVARLVLRDAQEAEDATHDAFTRAWRDLHRLRDLDRMDAWFGRILVNACRDRLRRRRHRSHDPLDEAVVHPAAPDTRRRIEDRDALDRAFAALNPDQRLAIVLRYYGDLDVDEVAQAVGAPVGTVRSRLHYALRHLRGALERTDR